MNSKVLISGRPILLLITIFHQKLHSCLHFCHVDDTRVTHSYLGLEDNWWHTGVLQGYLCLTLWRHSRDFAIFIVRPLSVVVWTFQSNCHSVISDCFLLTSVRRRRKNINSCILETIQNTCLDTACREITIYVCGILYGFNDMQNIFLLSFWWCVFIYVLASVLVTLILGHYIRSFFLY